MFAWFLTPFFAWNKKELHVRRNSNEKLNIYDLICIFLSSEDFKHASS